MVSNKNSKETRGYPPRGEVHASVCIKEKRTELLNEELSSLKLKQCVSKGSLKEISL